MLPIRLATNNPGTDHSDTFHGVNGPRVDATSAEWWTIWIFVENWLDIKCKAYDCDKFQCIIGFDIGGDHIKNCHQNDRYYACIHRDVHGSIHRIRGKFWLKKGEKWTLKLKIVWRLGGTTFTRAHLDSTSIHASQMMCLMHAVDGKMEIYAIEKKIRKLFECARGVIREIARKEKCVSLRRMPLLFRTRMAASISLLLKPACLPKPKILPAHSIIPQY